MFKKLHDAIQFFAPEVMPPVLKALGMKQEDYQQLRDQVVAARHAPPRIALVGETGVGKSTTINALFNQNLPVSHSRACTQRETELAVENGTLKVVDMPGLGEDVDRDREHMALYRNELPKCDVVVLVLKADNRAIASVQRSLSDLIAGGALNPQRLVVGLNQVDALHPGDWRAELNIPSAAQEAHLNERLADVRERLGKVSGVDVSRIVAYSALKNYRLADMLTAMKDAAERRVQWVLGDLANYRMFDADLFESEGD